MYVAIIFFCPAKKYIILHSRIAKKKKRIVVKWWQTRFFHVIKSANNNKAACYCESTRDEPYPGACEAAVH